MDSKDHVVMFCDRVVNAARHVQTLHPNDAALTRTLEQYCPSWAGMTYAEMLAERIDVTPSPGGIVFEAVQGSWFTFVSHTAPDTFVYWLYNIFTGEIVLDRQVEARQVDAIRAVTRLALERNS